MAKLAIVTLPNASLRQVAEEVSHFSPELTELAENMFDLMRAANGVGLAANQLASPERMFVYGFDEAFEVDGVMVESVPVQAIINPVVTPIGDQTDVEEEGCLSIPNLYGPVRRAVAIQLEAQDIHGQPISRRVSGYEARIIQHETDHLNGILFLDKLTDPTKLRRA